MIVLITLVAFIPLYGLMYPLVVDLAEHMLVSKLLWEKLTGTSHLDLTISWYLGYRLFPILMLVIFSFCQLLGISFADLPAIVPGVLIFIHVVVIVSILYYQLEDKSWQSLTVAGCFVLPAVVGMYSAAWFLGLVNYTLAITLLVPGVLLTERFLRSGKWIDATWVFLALAIAYMAHPFSPTFWVLWCLCRGGASLATQHLAAEWKRFAVLVVLFLPIFVYHSIYHVRWGGSFDSSSEFLNQPPIIPIRQWYEDRLSAILNGTYLKVDDMSSTRTFGIFAIAFILTSTALACRPGQQAHLKMMALANLFLLFIASWLNEKCLPVPSGTWLAYGYRYSLVVYVLCLTIAAVIVIRSLPPFTSNTIQQLAFAFLAFTAVFASSDHLRSVRQGYVRFDVPARAWMEKILADQQPDGIYLPHNAWHPDGTHLRNYTCLTQPDCVTKGTTFSTGYAADLYPVKLPPTEPKEGTPRFGVRPR